MSCRNGTVSEWLPLREDVHELPSLGLFLQQDQNLGVVASRDSDSATVDIYIISAIKDKCMYTWVRLDQIEDLQHIIGDVCLGDNTELAASICYHDINYSRDCILVTEIQHVARSSHTSTILDKEEKQKVLHDDGNIKVSKGSHHLIRWRSFGVPPRMPCSQCLTKNASGTPARKTEGRCPCAMLFCLAVTHTLSAFLKCETWFIGFFQFVMTCAVTFDLDFNEQFSQV